MLFALDRPGVAGAYMLGVPFSLGAFLSGGLAAGAMLFLNQRTKLKEDAIIGLIFTSFFGLGLFMVSLSPTSVNIQTIVLGNILAVTPEDTLQLVIIAGVSLAILLVKWKDLMVTFFDENHARSIGLNPTALKILFFTLLSACTVAALQTVGAFLVIAMVVTPGATAYLLTDRFPRLIAISVAIGALSSSSAPMPATSWTARPAASSSSCRRSSSSLPFSSHPSMGCLPPGGARPHRSRAHDRPVRHLPSVHLSLHAASPC